MIVTRPAKLRARTWDGPPPEPGDYIVPMGRRARTAFRLLARRPGRKVKFILVCERLRISDVPGDATRYWWRWERRSGRSSRAPLLD